MNIHPIPQRETHVVNHLFKVSRIISHYFDPYKNNDIDNMQQQVR